MTCGERVGGDKCCEKWLKLELRLWSIVATKMMTSDSVESKCARACGEKAGSVLIGWLE